jgi:hypothetical protein
MWILASVLMVALPGTAPAQTWKARAELIETKSAEGCARNLSVYTLSLDGRRFSAADVDGNMFTVPIADTWVINETYRSPSGSRLEMSGNVKTRHLEVYSNQRGCWWRLVPER